MAAFGTAVARRADEMALEMARNDAVDSLPPIFHSLELKIQNVKTNTFQYGGIAGFDSQCRNVGNHFRTGFEDDKEDSNGAGDPFKDQAIVQ